MSDLIKRDEVWQALHNIGGCDAGTDIWADGWDKAIDAAIGIVEALPAAKVDTTSKITEAEQIEVLNRNVLAHGTNFETGIAMEECAELIQAISKVRRYGLIGKYKSNIIEEIADVNIIILELALMYDLSYEDIAKEMDRKIERLKLRLDDKEKECI